MKRKNRHGRVGVRKSVAQHDREVAAMLGYRKAWEKRARLERAFLEPLLQETKAKDIHREIADRLGL